MSKCALYFLLICTACDLTTIAQEGKDTSINLYFKTDSFSLESVQSQNLKNFFSSFPEIKKIIGYTDSTGEPDYNFSLSKKRAFSVFALLQTHIDSLTEDLVTFRGESSSLPQLWMNRRVQVIALLINPRVVAEKSDNSRIDTAARAARDPSSDAKIKKGYHNNNDTVGSHLTSAPTELNADITSDTVSNFYLENVYFVPDKPIVRSESLPSIQEVARILKNHSKEKIEIIGHINYQSRFDSTHLRDLFKLSEQRAKKIYDYLTELGISNSRMTFKGVGNSQPTYPRPVNDEQRRKNMRVQIIIKK